MLPGRPVNHQVITSTRGSRDPIALGFYAIVTGHSHYKLVACYFQQAVREHLTYTWFSRSRHAILLRLRNCPVNINNPMPFKLWLDRFPRTPCQKYTGNKKNARAREKDSIRNAEGPPGHIMLELAAAKPSVLNE
jgi:hypothetical protein